jgi:hypothetical protein
MVQNAFSGLSCYHELSEPGIDCPPKIVNAERLHTRPPYDTLQRLVNVL